MLNFELRLSYAANKCTKKVEILQFTKNCRKGKDKWKKNINECFDSI